MHNNSLSVMQRN